MLQQHCGRRNTTYRSIECNKQRVRIMSGKYGRTTHSFTQRNDEATTIEHRNLTIHQQKQTTVMVTAEWRGLPLVCPLRPQLQTDLHLSDHALKGKRLSYQHQSLCRYDTFHAMTLRTKVKWCTGLHADTTRHLSSYCLVLGRTYGDTVAENSSVFSLIRMRWLPPARALEQ